MSPERTPEKQPNRLEQIEEINFSQLVEAFISSDQFTNRYSKYTQTHYRERLKTAKEELQFLGETNLSSVAQEALVEKVEPAILKPHVRMTVRNAIRWANDQGLTDETFIPKKRKPKEKKVKIIVKKKTPEPKTKLTIEQKKEIAYFERDHQILSPDTLEKLFREATPEHRAIFSVILSTRAPQSIVRNLTTDDIIINENGQTTVSCDNKKLNVNPYLAVHLKRYKAEAKSSYILARSKNYKSGDNPFSRQRTQQMLDEYKEKLIIPEKLNYTTFVDTGIAMFGYIYYPTPQSRNSK